MMPDRHLVGSPVTPTATTCPLLPSGARRQQLRLLVKDVAAAKNAYGPYTTPLPTDSAGPRALRGVKCLVLLGRPARGLLEAAKAAKVKHVVLVGAAPAGEGDTAAGNEPCPPAVLPQQSRTAL
jgi:hypothetical protein